MGRKKKIINHKIVEGTVVEAIPARTQAEVAIAAAQAKELKYLKTRELTLLKKTLEIRENLPHLYGYKWYQWAWDFFNSRNKICLLTASNQCSKSSTQIRRIINWATDVTKWKELWPKSTPRVFWYLYPSSDVATIEFEKKWVPEFMPRGVMKGHAQYGWKANYKSGNVESVDFNSGVTIYFKTYSQKLQNLQTGSVHYVATDEELPLEILPELMLRISAANINGYFSMVFTATLNQDFWRRAIEPSEKEDEVYPDAFKQQISLYDCMYYRDGTPGPWTEEIINEVKNRCGSETEIQRRVYGRFVTEGGRKFHAYDASRHFIKPRPIGPDWKIYSGIDHGSGGEKAHPAAVCFVAVSPDHKLGYVFRGWRGDGIQTTAGDTIDKWKELCGGLIVTRSFYDYGAADLATIATRQGETLERANKSVDLGHDTLNTLFKNDMLFIFDDEPGQLAKLSGELTALMKNAPKERAKDDLADSLRYACVSIPWDWTAIIKDGGVELPVNPQARPLTDAEILADQLSERRGEYGRKTDDAWAELEEEFREYNESY